MPAAAHILPARSEAAIETLVDTIEARPGAMVDPRVFDEIQGTIDARKVLSTRPEGLSEEDLIGILRLAMLTECATDLYGDLIRSNAIKYDAPWLVRFNDRVWVPDEMSHATPYRILLQELGFSDDELQRQITAAQQTVYEHNSGNLPIQLTTFGMVQEYLTDNWHGLIAKFIRPTAPVASRMIAHIKRRETLHTIWYRDMTAMQLEGRPDSLPLVAHTLATFRMPGNSIVPELQAESPRWLPLLNADYDRIGRDLIRLIYETMGDARRSGQLVIELAAEKGMALGPLPLRHVRSAVNKLGGPGYGLFGEAMLEKFGLVQLVHRERLDGQPSPAEKIRGLLRSWVARQLDQRVDFGTLLA